MERGVRMGEDGNERVIESSANGRLISFLELAGEVVTGSGERDSDLSTEQCHTMRSIATHWWMIGGISRKRRRCSDANRRTCI